MNKRKHSSLEVQQRYSPGKKRVPGRDQGKRVKKGPMRRKRDRRGWYLMMGVLGLIAVIIVVFIFLSYQSIGPNAKPRLADQTVVQQVTGVSQTTWEAVGTGGLANPFQPPLRSQPSLAGSPGHPLFLYVGAEWCPNCAAERWAMINALSRFGTFSHLRQIQSDEGGISTFTFEGSSYSSRYVNFVPKEIQGNNRNSSAPLDTLTVPEQQVFSTYNGFPFVDIGNQYALAQTSYTPQVLQDTTGNPLPWQEIAGSLSNPQSPITQGILGSANYLTAAICTLTHQRPGNVCQSPVIRQIEQGLGKTSNTPSSQVLALAPTDLRAARRRVLG